MFSRTAYVYESSDYSVFSAGTGGQTCRYSGIWSTTDGWEGPGGENMTCATDSGAAHQSCVYASCLPNDPNYPTAGLPESQYVFGVAVVGAGSQFRAGFKNYLEDLDLYVSDRDAPTVDPGSPGIPSGWVSHASFSGHAHDSGVGVQSLALSSDVSPSFSASWPSGGCSIDPDNQCPTDATVTPSSDQLNEGINTISATAADLIGGSGHTASGTLGQVKVDRTAPVVSVSGSLRDAAGQRISDGAYTLSQASATDTPASSVIATSGVTSLEIDIDGQKVAGQTQSCSAGGCTLSLSPYTYYADQNALGTHDVTVKATDAAGNVGSQSWTFEVGHTASAAVGPGSVNLASGDFRLDRSDVSIAAVGPGLSVGRTYNSRNVGASGGSQPFGPGWSSTLPVDDPAADYLSLAETPDQAIVALTLSDGTSANFRASGSGGFTAPKGWQDLTLTKPQSGEYEVKDLQGDDTIFTQPSGSTVYVPSQTSEAASSTTNKFVYQVVNGTPRLSEVIAPTPGVTCSASSYPQGCRLLSLVYASTTTATGTASGSWGDYAGRISHASLTAWDPTSASMVTAPVVDYQYDSTGLLRAAWDPRISPALKETYAYDSQAHLTQVTPPGQQPWTLAYQSDSSTPGQVKLQSASRATSAGTATETITYGVPTSGSGAPYAMAPGNVTAWHQSDTPTQATAIFPPDEVPSSSPPSDYNRATVYYLDAQGRDVNTALPRAHISTSEYDAQDNVIRELTAANRERALTTGSSSATTAQTLDTQYTYSSDFIDLTAELGPQHQVQLAGGQTVQARQHAVTTYDEGSPGGRYHLPTTVTEGAQITGQSSDCDVRTTKLSYNGQSNLGWTLRLPTSTTVDGVSGGLNLTTTNLYDQATGAVTETRQPANPTGGDAHAMQTILYAAGNTSDATCSNHPEYAGLACKEQPAAQPGTTGLPVLPVTTYTYNRLAEPLTRTDTVGGDQRTTTFTYDQAGRETNDSVSAPVQDGAAVPSVATTYDPALGLPSTTTSTDATGNTATITRGYDNLGRLTSYQDADVNTATTTYDLLGRPSQQNDGKGTQSYSYDATTGYLTGLTDSAAGTFSATYDADGQMLSETLPNGLQQQNTYDEAGELVHRSYVKTTNCSTNCTWLDFGGAKSIHDEWLTTTGTLGSRTYTYDQAGRLTQAQDNPQGQGCTVRQYSYDQDSNRTAETTHAPATDGACAPTSTGSSVSHSYDAADRLTDTGTLYDNYSRITTLPAQDAGGTALTETYYTNDLQDGLAQGTSTRTDALDPMLRPRTETSVGTTTPTATFHYTDDADASAWTANSLGYTRTILGIDGNLAAIQDMTSGTSLQLANLHDDVVATATLSATASGPTHTFQADEFGVPQQPSQPTYSWLGGIRRRTMLDSGTIDMGLRTYVPQIGRFMQPDPVPNGSSNTYDYADQDPVNSSDPSGASRREPLESGCGVAFEWKTARLRTGWVFIGTYTVLCRKISIAYRARAILYRGRHKVPEQEVEGTGRRFSVTAGTRFHYGLRHNLRVRFVMFAYALPYRGRPVIWRFHPRGCTAYGPDLLCDIITSLLRFDRFGKPIHGHH